MDSKVCSICGKTLNVGPAPDPGEVFSGWQDVTLMDGNMVCSDCTEKVRILYPLRSSKTFVESGFRFGYDEVREKTIARKGWVNALVDPLEKLTLEEFVKAQSDAQQAAQDAAVRFPGAKAAAEADFTYRHHVVAAGTNHKTLFSDKKEYVACVKVLFGEIRPGD